MTLKHHVDSLLSNSKENFSMDVFTVDLTFLNKYEYCMQWYEEIKIKKKWRKIAQYAY